MNGGVWNKYHEVSQLIFPGLVTFDRYKHSSRQIPRKLPDYR